MDMTRPMSGERKILNVAPKYNIFLMRGLRYSRVYAYYVAGRKMSRCCVFDQCVDVNVNIQT